MDLYHRQTGAALIVCIVLAAALAVLNLSTMRATGIETAMIRSAKFISGARMAATSALAAELAATTIPPNIEQVVARRHGADNEYESFTETRFIGETTLPPGFSAASGDAGFITQHYEIRTEVHGLRNTAAIQRQGFYIVSLADPR